MGKRTDRAAWGLAVVLAVVLLGGIVGMIGYVRQTGYYSVCWQRRDYWVGHYVLTDQRGKVWRRNISLGYIQVLIDSEPDPDPPVSGVSQVRQ